MNDKRFSNLTVDNVFVSNQKVVTKDLYADRIILNKSTNCSSDIQSVSGTNDPGTSSCVARIDHTHEGVHSFQADSSSQLVGDIKLVSGSGISTSVIGNNITINSNQIESYARATQTTPQSVLALTKVTLSSLDSSKNITLSSSDLKASVPGTYTINFQVTFNRASTTASPNVYAQIALNNTDIYAAVTNTPFVGFSNGLKESMNITAVVPMNGTTDFVNCSVSVSASGVTISNPASPTRVSMTYSYPL